jgi:hypothetical protein
MEVRGSRCLGDGDLASVDEVGVDLVAYGLRAHSEHAVLGVQHDAAVVSKMVGDLGGQTDAEVDEGAGGDVAGDDSG